MAKVAFVFATNSSGPEEKIAVDFDGARSLLDTARLQALQANPEPISQPSDSWLVETGQNLFHLLALRPEHLEDDRTLEIDFTQLPAAHSLTTLPWELLHDGTLHLAQQAIPVVRIVRQVNRKPSVAANRALSLLFQACSPENTTVLDFEKEEAAILKASGNQSIDLLTEETGTLDGLDRIVATRAGQIDAFHLTGHADLFDSQGTPDGWLAEGRARPADGTPVFLMENDVGKCELATANDLSDYGFRDAWPKLVFVSGCRTGHQQSAIPSMARSLIGKGVPAVLAWRQPVRDTTATEAAREIYTHVGDGYSIEKSLGRALKFLSQRNSEGACEFPDWHLLQLYRDSSTLGALVTAPSTAGRTKAKRLAPEKAFLGAKPVVGPDGFVGRRRPLQRCLGALLEDRVVVLWGVGGLGKSSVAAHLCRRLMQRWPGTRQIVIRGRLTEATVRDSLRPLAPQLSLPAALDEFLARPENTQFLLVLDNFEDNQQVNAASAGGFLLDGEARKVLAIIEEALADGRGRLILTTRYWHAETFPSLGHHHAESLSALAEADIVKKQDRMHLELGEAESLNLATASCGNPRLLENLASAAPEQWGVLREQYLESDLRFGTLWTQLDPAERQSVAELAVCRLPLPVVAVEALRLDLNKAVALAIVETGQDSRAVSAVARPAVPELDAAAQVRTAKVLAPLLHRGWRQTEGFTMAHRRELLRLGLLADDAEVCGSNGDQVALSLRNRNEWQEARQLCELLLARFRDYRLLSTYSTVLAHLGETASALQMAKASVELCPTQEHAELAAAYHSLGSLQNLQGQPEAALKSFGEALACAKSMEQAEAGSGSGSKAASLHEMAGVLAQQGEVEAALGLWRESLAIKEKIGDVQGKAATLHNMAGTLFQTGDKPQAARYLIESAKIFGGVRGYFDLVTVLSNLAAVDSDDRTLWLAQALWLAMRIQMRPVQRQPLFEGLFHRVPAGHRLKRNLALLFSQSGDLKVAGDKARQLFSIAAQGAGVSPESAQAWFEDLLATEASQIASEVETDLIELVGDRWIFDREPLALKAKGQAVGE